MEEARSKTDPGRRTALETECGDVASVYATVAGSYGSTGRGEAGAVPEYVGGPGWLRGGLTVLGLLIGLGYLAGQGDTGDDEWVGRLGRVEVTARLMERPEQFPQLGAYRYTYVLRYEVVRVHRSDPEGRYRLQPGDMIFVGHYKPWMPRSQIRDADWGESPLGGRLTQWVTGDAHRMALDYELGDLAPSGALDYGYPPGTNRFFAVWTNPTTY